MDLCFDPRICLHCRIRLRHASVRAELAVARMEPHTIVLRVLELVEVVGGIGVSA